MDTQDKVRGMFLGIAIGDALGAPAEGYSLQRIRDRWGKLTNYMSAEGHKWLDSLPLGGWTDDTHLTLAVARGLIQDKGFSLPGQVFHHILAMQKNDTGWGPTTKDAILKLHQGVDPRESGSFKAPDAAGKGARGVGNGIPMKNGPLAALFHSQGASGWHFATENMVSWTAMTHPSSVAVSSCFAHFFTMLYCLGTASDKFDPKVFVFKAHSGAVAGERYFPETLTDRMAERIQSLLTPRTEEQIVADFNGGKSYVFDSLPFAYAYFLRDYDSIECVYNAASAGGDTDTNASIVGGLLGALHGIKVFPTHLIDGLHNREEVEAVVHDFNLTFFPAA